MAKLDWSDAQVLAGSLTTIGHPYTEAAIKATALDLVNWCEGSFQDGYRIISPREQGQMLVDEARYNWTEWKGTAAFRALFKSLFDPQSAAAENQTFATAMPPACELCADTGWEPIVRNGYECSRLCTGCGGKRKASVVCPKCCGKETRLIEGRREPCDCLTAERRAQIREFLSSLRPGGED